MIMVRSWLMPIALVCNVASLGAGSAANGPEPGIDAVQQGCPDCKHKVEFEQFSRSHGRSYDTIEAKRRLKIFENSLKRVEELNRNRATASDAFYTITKFADFTFDELVQFATGGIEGGVAAPEFDAVLSGFPAAPKSFDWADARLVPEARDQGSVCASSYAFAIADLVAAQWAIENGSRDKRPQQLSAQVTLDCVPRPAAFGCKGGDPLAALKVIINCKSCLWPSEACYPYEGKGHSTCRAQLGCAGTSDAPFIRAKGSFEVDVTGDHEKESVSALIRRGPLAAMVTVTDHWQHYADGIIRSSHCGNATSQQHHVVLITGYDFSGPVPFYNIKNSWGKEWGRNGYMRIEAGANACGIATRLIGVCAAAECSKTLARFPLQQSRKLLQSLFSAPAESLQDSLYQPQPPPPLVPPSIPPVTSPPVVPPYRPPPNPPVTSYVPPATAPPGPPPPTLPPYEPPPITPLTPYVPPTRPPPPTPPQPTVPPYTPPPSPPTASPTPVTLPPSTASVTTKTPQPPSVTPQSPSPPTNTTPNIFTERIPGTASTPLPTPCPSPALGPNVVQQVFLVVQAREPSPGPAPVVQPPSQQQVVVQPPQPVLQQQQQQQSQAIVPILVVPPPQPPPASRAPGLFSDEFEAYLRAFNKQYNDQEKARRAAIFENNLKLVRDLNDQRRSPSDAYFGYTKYSDLDFEEFKKAVGSVPLNRACNKFTGDVSNVTFPQRFDWNERGVVTTVRDQGLCGACYGFTAADLLSSQWSIDHNEAKPPPLLSAQVAVDCPPVPFSFGCGGGYPDLILASVADAPWPSESCYPYARDRGNCSLSAACVESQKPVVQVNYVPSPLNVTVSQEKEIVASLLQGGPLIAYVQTTRQWQLREKGILTANTIQQEATIQNHVVLITGYDFTGPTPYYIAKNSWGDDWKEGGYIYLEADANTSGVGQCLVSACTENCDKTLRPEEFLISRSVKQLQSRTSRLGGSRKI